MLSPHIEHRHLITRIETVEGTVVLSDHSQWHVNPEDQSKLKDWSTFEEVEVTLGEGHGYKLFHIRRQEVLAVQRLR